VKFANCARTGRSAASSTAPTPEERRSSKRKKRKYDEDDRLRSQQQATSRCSRTYASLEEIEAARKRALADQHVILERVNQRKDEIQA